MKWSRHGNCASRDRHESGQPTLAIDRSNPRGKHRAKRVLDPQGQDPTRHDLSTAIAAVAETWLAVLA